MATPAAPADTDIVAGHLARYTDPDKLASHLRVAHKLEILTSEAGDLDKLREIHAAATH